METEKVKILEAEIAEVEKVEAQNVKDTETTTKRLEQAQARVVSITADHLQARTERQKILARDGDPGKVNIRVGNLRTEEELLEDTIIGLKNRLDELNEERGRLPKEKRAIEQEIVRLKLKPLVDRFNQQGGELAKTTQRIYELMYELSCGFSPLNSSGSPIYPSSWEGALERIQQLFWVEDLKAGTNVRGQDFFNEVHCREIWNKKKALKAAVGA